LNGGLSLRVGAENCNDVSCRCAHLSPTVSLGVPKSL